MDAVASFFVTQEDARLTSTEGNTPVDPSGGAFHEGCESGSIGCAKKILSFAT